MPATREISIAPSPSSRQPSRSAMSWSRKGLRTLGYPQTLESLLDRRSASADQVHDHEDDGDDEQDVNRSRGDFERPPERPEDKEQNDQCPQHEMPPLASRGPPTADWLCSCR